MKSLGVVLIATLSACSPAPEDAEAKKKRLGEIMGEMTKLQGEAEKLLNDLSGGDARKREALILELARKHAPEQTAAEERKLMASNARNASTSLKTLVSAEDDFRSNDRDWNRVNDYWVADVSGLYRILWSKDDGMKLIERSVALADGRPALPLENEGALPVDSKTKFMAMEKGAPKAGYCYVAIPKYEGPDGGTATYDEGNGRNRSRYAFCAYPVEYEKMGQWTFVVDENKAIYRKRTEGKPLEVWPTGLKKAGWEKLD
jgi:hypothetical protein